MTWDVQKLRSPAIITIFWEHNVLDGALCVDRVDFDTHLEVAGQSNNLQVVSINVELFYLSCAKACNVSSHEVFV